MTKIDCGYKDCRNYGQPCKADKIKIRKGKCITYDNGRLNVSIHELMSVKNPKCLNRKADHRRVFK